MLLWFVTGCYGPASWGQAWEEAHCERAEECAGEWTEAGYWGGGPISAEECVEEASAWPDDWCKRIDQRAADRCIDEYMGAPCMELLNGEYPWHALCDSQVICAEGYNP